MSKKIIFVGGGTLGHVLPILPIAEELSTKYQLYFIGTKKGLEKDFFDKNDNFKKNFQKSYFLDMQGLKRSLSFKNIITFCKYIKCNWQARQILKEIAPDLIIGMGGYISGVVVQRAIKMKIKTLIHEQNSVLGLSNRLVYKKVEKVLLSFPIPTLLKGVVVGNPRLTEIKKKYQNCEKDNFLLVVGGSRGSKVINDNIIALEKELKKACYEVLLIVGTKYFVENEEIINDVNSRETITIFPFVDNLIPHLAKASVVISRSGATTLNEIIALNKVSLLIPSINVTANHQEKNALMLTKQNAALMIKEADLNKDKLLDAIESLMFNYQLRKTIKNNLQEMSQLNALDLFIKEVEKLL